MNDEDKQRYIDALELALHRLIKRSSKFLSGDVVDEASGTIPLKSDLERAINDSKDLLKG